MVAAATAAVDLRTPNPEEALGVPPAAPRRAVEGRPDIRQVLQGAGTLTDRSRSREAAAPSGQGPAVEAYTARILGAHPAGHQAASRLVAEDTPGTDSLLRTAEGRTGNRDCPVAGDRTPGAGIHRAAAAAAVVGCTGDNDVLDSDSLGILRMTAGTVLARDLGEGIDRRAHGDRGHHEGRGHQGAVVLEVADPVPGEEVRCSGAHHLSKSLHPRRCLCFHREIEQRPGGLAAES